jgi:glutamine synthetase
MSIFLGSQLEDIVEQLVKGAASTSKRGGTVELGVTSLPVLPRDATDRNRTSPFAFTGNKFEVRAVGSSAPIYWPQTILNTAVADALEQLADKLEKLDAGDFAGLTRILSETVQRHRRVLFEGNNYSDEWHAEAARRGLPNNRSTVDSLPSLTEPKAIELFSRLGVLSERELTARADINWERYVKICDIEASCALDMARTMVLPAGVRYLGELAAAGSSTGVAAISDRVASTVDMLVAAIHDLEHAQHAAHEAGSVRDEAVAFRETVIPAQGALRAAADELETLVADDLWPMPKYRELLFQY